MNQIFQIFISGCDDPDIDGDHAVTAQTHDFPFLQNPQKPSLKIEGDFGDLIQKDGAIVGNFEKTGLAALSGTR